MYNIYFHCRSAVKSALAFLKVSFSNAYDEIKEFLLSYIWVKEVVDFINGWDSKTFENQALSTVSTVEVSSGYLITNFNIILDIM